MCILRVDFSCTQKNPRALTWGYRFQAYYSRLLFLSGRSYPTISSKKKRETLEQVPSPSLFTKNLFSIKRFRSFGFCNPAELSFQVTLSGVSSVRDISLSKEVSVLRTFYPWWSFNFRGIASFRVSAPLRGTSLPGEPRTKDY